MNDIERAAELASTVLPGPIGEAVAIVLIDHSEDECPDPNINELAHRIKQAKGSLDAIHQLSPEEGHEFMIGLAARFMTNRETDSPKTALRWAETAVQSLIAMSPRVPVAGEPEGGQTVNLVGHLLYLTKLVRESVPLEPLADAGYADVLKASAVARLVHPGPVGAAIEDLLAYGAASRSAFRNIHLIRLAAAVLDAAPDASA